MTTALILIGPKVSKYIDVVNKFETMSFANQNQTDSKGTRGTLLLLLLLLSLLLSLLLFLPSVFLRVTCIFAHVFTVMCIFAC